MATTPYLAIPLFGGSESARLDTLLNDQATAIDTNVKAKLDAIHEDLDPLVEDTGWVDIRSSVSLASGLAWNNSGTALWVRRAGPVVGIKLDFVRTTSSGFVSVPFNGNIENKALVSGIPSQYCPSGANASAALSSVASGRVASFYITSDGQVLMSAITPSSNASGAESLPSGELLSFGGTFLR